MQALYTIILKMVDEETPILLEWPTHADNGSLESKEKEFRKIYQLLPAEQIEKVIDERLLRFNHRYLGQKWTTWKLDKGEKPVIRCSSRDDAKVL